VTHRSTLDGEIAAWCAGADLATIQEVADAAGIGNSRYNTASDVLAHPHLAARDRWREVDTPNGPVPALLPPLGERMDPVPGLGEHTDAILRELGVLDPPPG
ncbi:MAG: CoA transferase, partial [Pseudonocardia sp.]|nr:CoA transferase [Pseudonocardia sp.]